MSTADVDVAAGTGGVPAATPDQSDVPAIPAPTIPPPMAADVVAAWGELSNVHKSKTANAGTYSYAYGDLGDLVAMARPILAKHNLALIQPLSRRDSPVVTIHTMLVHSSGHVMEWTFDVQGGQSPQQTGSGVTYGRRYAAGGALGVAYEDDDDDGKAAETAPPPPAQESFDDAIPGPTAVQTRRVFALFDKLGVTDRKARLALTSEILDRDVESWSKVPADEALVVIEALAERVDALKAPVDAP